MTKSLQKDLVEVYKICFNLRLLSAVSILAVHLTDQWSLWSTNYDYLAIIKQGLYIKSMSTIISLNGEL